MFIFMNYCFKHFICLEIFFSLYIFFVFVVVVPFLILWLKYYYSQMNYEWNNVVVFWRKILQIFLLVCLGRFFFPVEFIFNESGHFCFSRSWFLSDFIQVINRIYRVVLLSLFFAGDNDDWKITVWLWYWFWFCFDM